MTGGPAASRQRHLLHIFPAFAVGGSQMRFRRLVELHGARYRHTVISLNGNLEMAPRITSGDVTFAPLEMRKTGFAGSILRYRRLLSALRPDVLVTYNWGAIEWAMANRLAPVCRHVHIEDGFGPEEARRQLSRRIWARRLALSGGQSAVVVPSRTLEDMALSRWRLNRKTLRFVPNGVDCDRFNALEAASPSSLTIGTVASLRPEKNLARLLTAFDRLAADLPDCRLLIVGDGAERTMLEAMAQSLKSAPRIRFAGDSSTPEQWLRQMDIFALSSDTEQMPISVLEAMATGLPLISTAVGDVAQMIAPDNAPFVVPAHAFGGALQALARAPDARRRIGQANRARAVACFDEKQMAGRYAELFG